jgi:hypothetical protein
MRFWRRMEKISWTGGVRNAEGIRRIKVEKNILYVIKRRKASCIGHALLRNCLLNTLLREREREGEGGKGICDGKTKRKK